MSRPRIRTALAPRPALRLGAALVLLGSAVSASPRTALDSRATPGLVPEERVWRDASGAPLPFRGDAQVSDFLRTARVVESEGTHHGTRGVRKLRLERDGLIVHAAERTHAETDRVRQIESRFVLGFRDHFIHEPAAYALSELLHLDMVPPAVPREIHGRPASVQIWVEDSLPVVESLRVGFEHPAPQRYVMQINHMRIFDNLVDNLDRNQGNILIGADGLVWLIDHSQAFARDPHLPAPDDVRRIGRRFWERLRSVSDEEIASALEPYLEEPERSALLERRHELVELIEERIATLGESSVVDDRLGF